MIFLRRVKQLFSSCTFNYKKCISIFYVITRDGGQTLGLYLILRNVKLNDYGQYVCSVSNTDDQITEIQSELTNTRKFVIKFMKTIIIIYLWK